MSRTKVNPLSGGQWSDLIVLLLVLSSYTLQHGNRRPTIKLKFLALEVAVTSQPQDLKMELIVHFRLFLLNPDHLPPISWP